MEVPIDPEGSHGRHLCNPSSRDSRLGRSGRVKACSACEDRLALGRTTNGKAACCVGIDVVRDNSGVKRPCAQPGFLI